MYVRLQEFQKLSAAQMHPNRTPASKPCPVRVAQLWSQWLLASGSHFNSQVQRDALRTSTRDRTPIVASWYQAIECLIRKHLLDRIIWAVRDYAMTSSKIFGEESPAIVKSSQQRTPMFPIGKTCCFVFQATTCDVLCLGYTPFRAAMCVLWYKRNFCLVSSKKQPKILTTAAFWLASY